MQFRDTRTIFAVTIALSQAACASDEPPLARGDQGPQVLELTRYLQTYGYLPNPALAERHRWVPFVKESPADPQVFDEVLERALVEYQTFYGLPARGVLDEPTRRLMAEPRCGFPDSRRTPERPQTSDYAVHSKWPTGTLTYSFTNFTPDLDAGTVQWSIGGAANSWAAVAPLSLTQIGGGGDIDIGFFSGQHGDDPFDGPFGTLAHAYYPAWGGDIHFDEDETWSTDGSTPIDLESVAVHEFGHSLGLQHTNDPGAVMFPTINGIRRGLGWDDVQGIQALYLRVPSPLAASSERCFGYNNASWPAQPGATFYELYRSFSSSFSNPSLVYSGASTDAFLNVNGTWYLRVRACNAIGCSDFSNQAVATYWSGPCA